jgi:gliding motility-associated-like protein
MKISLVQKATNKVARIGMGLLLALLGFSQTANAQYCAATSTDCGFEYITNFTLNSINNNSACDNPYDDFTAQVATVQIGQAYPGTASKSGVATTYLMSIFIDWNQNGTFDLPAEEIQANPNANTNGFEFSITAPAGALLGTTRMRVRMVQFSNTPAPCGTAARGDLEDYTINVINPAPPANDNCANAAFIAPASTCSNTAGNTFNGTQQLAPTACSGNTAAAANEVWYSFTANGTDPYQIRVTGTGGFDPVIGFYTGCAATDLVICKDSSIINQTEIINTGVLAAGTYNYRIYGNGGNGTFTTCVIEPNSGPLTYCAASSTDCGFEFITNFTLNTINNNSGCDAPYDDFTTQIATVQLGQGYPGTASKSGTVANYVMSIFIDWNQNGVFDLPGEETQASPNANTNGFDFTITPPAGALLGTTRMRVRMVQLSNTALPCGASTRGDVEDYTIEITPSAPPANDDCVNAAVITPTAGCTNVAGTTANGTQQLPPTNCSGNTAAAANEVWYTFTANGTDSYQIRVTGTGGFDPVLGFYSGCTAADLIICKDTSLINQTEVINTGILTAGTYYYRVYGNGGNGTFNTCVIQSSSSGAIYCPATNTDCNFEYITFVGLTTIGNSSDCGLPYDDYTNQVAYLQVGQTYVGTAKKSDIIANYLFSAFIDWNQDGLFDATEAINATANGTSDYSFTVIPPLGALLGDTRMRVRLEQTNNPTSCGAAARGDIEDYTVNLSNSPAPLPSHNLCSNALQLSPDLDCGEVEGGSTIGSTQQFPPTACGGTAAAAAANDVWFSFQANGSSAYQITVSGTNGFNPILALYSGCTAASMMECRDETGANGSENINTGVIPAGTYFYRVYGNGDDGTFYHCIIELLPQDEYDCETARLLCSKDPITETDVRGFGLNGAEATGSCLVGGVDLSGNTEQNSKWYRWTASNNGDLTFNIIPDDAGVAAADSLDVDFVVFELDPNLGCEGKTMLRCMGASCKGPTGLNATSLDVAEPADCNPPNDNYLQQLTQTAGTEYAILINNFDDPGRGYEVQFGGTATFQGAKAAFTAVANPDCAFPKTITTTDLSIDADTYAWDFGAGSTPPTATTAGPHTISYNTFGLKTLSLTVTSTNGCDSTVTLDVEIVDTMDASATMIESTCEQANGEVTINVTGGNGTAADKTYSLDGGAPQASNNFTGLTPGAHTVTVTDAVNCAKDVNFTVNTTLNPIVDDLIDVIACDNYTLPTITGTNITTNAAYFTGPGGTGTKLTAGTIISNDMMLYIFDSTSVAPTCTDEEDFTVTINTAPTVTNIARTCNGANTGYTVSFDVAGGNGGPYNVSSIQPIALGGSFTGSTWTSNSILNGVTYEFEVDDANSCGPIVITGSRNCNCVTQAGVMGTQALNICGNGQATATYNNTSEANDGNDVLSFVLHTGSGATLGTILQTGTAPVFSFGGGTAFGTTYYISAIIGDDDGSGGTDLTDACLDVAQGTPVTWYETPTADFSGNTSICSGESTPLTFNFTGVGPFTVTYSDGVSNFTLTNMSTGSTTPVSPTATTTYSLVSVVSSASTCNGTVSANTVTVTVSQAPSANSPTYICNATSTGYTTSFTVSGGNGGPYNVTEIQPGGIGGSFSGNVYTTNEIPNGTVFELQVDDDNDCGPLTVQGVHNCSCSTNAGTMNGQKINLCGPGNISATHNTGSMVLDANDVLEFVLHTNSSNILGTVIATNPTPDFSFGAGMTYGTTYYISAIAGNDNGSGSVDQSDPCMNVAVGTPVEWNETPTTTASTTNNNVCEGEDIELFSTNSVGSSYSWSGPASYVAFSQNPVRSNSTAGMTGTYTVTVTRNGCSSTSDLNITVNPSSDATISNTPQGPFCENDVIITLTAADQGGTWSGTGITDANQGIFDPAVAGAGMHTITYTVGTSCQATDTREIEVLAIPAVSFDADPQSGCDPLEVSFTNTTPNTGTALWQFGDTQSSTQTGSVDHTYGVGTYDVSLEITGTNGCINEMSQAGMINVTPTPTSSFSALNTDGAGAFTFTNESTGASSYTWTFGDGGSSDEFNPEYNYGEQAGSYDVILYAITAAGCIDSSSISVAIEEKVTYFIPNAFTPNGDPFNHYFMPVITSGIDQTSYSFKVYNRYGELIFQSNDVNVGWDGTFQNQIAPTGTYTWVIGFTSLSNDRKFAETGIVQLLN